MSVKLVLQQEEIQELLRLIHQVYGYDFSGYARGSLIRRIHKFMEDHQIQNGTELISLVVGNMGIFENFLETITVNVTEMFRDPGFYKALREKVLPVLASYPQINIWHAGCSTGEEVFSLCILLHEAELLHRSRIYATDINPANLARARTGVVPLHNMREYTVNYRLSGSLMDFSDYYTALYDKAIIDKQIRERIVFLQHNLVTDRSFNEFQLVICRNVMIYFNKDLQGQVLRLFYDSLAPFGFLGLGMKESLLFSEHRNRFAPVEPGIKLFKRKN
jgi:chemotaxis protein methyltransferase CheR